MELRALGYFVAAAEERNFTRAAARVHVSQSGLSATIRTLETELHAALFERTTRRVQLTAAGAALLPEARRALAAARAGGEAVSAVEGLRRGRLDLGVMQQMNLIGLPRTLARFHRRYPGVELRLRQASSRELHEFLLDGELDLIIASPERADERLTAVELLQTPLVLACRPDNPFAGRKSIRISDLTDLSLIGFPAGWAMHTLAQRAIGHTAAHLDFHFEVNDTATALDLVEAGLGVALIAEAIVAGRRGIHAVPLSGPPVNWTVSAVTADPAPSNPAARELWRLIKRSASARQKPPPP